MLITMSLLGSLALFAASEVKTDYNHAADFGQYKTYSWLKVKAGNDLWVDRITHSVDSELSSKGWTKVPSGGDVAVAAFGASQDQPSMETFYDNFGGGWGWRGFGGDGIATTTVEHTPVGSLVVDMFDGRSKKLIWRSVATDTLSDKPEKNEKKLDKAVSDMFKHFPPHTGG